MFDHLILHTHRAIPPQNSWMHQEVPLSNRQRSSISLRRQTNDPSKPSEYIYKEQFLISHCFSLHWVNNFEYPFPVHNFSSFENPNKGTAVTLKRPLSSMTKSTNLQSQCLPQSMNTRRIGHILVRFTLQDEHKSKSHTRVDTVQVNEATIRDIRPSLRQLGKHVWCWLSRA